MKYRVRRVGCLTDLRAKDIERELVKFLMNNKLFAAECVYVYKVRACGKRQTPKRGVMNA